MYVCEKYHQVDTKNYINYSKTTKTTYTYCFIDVSASRRKPSSGLTSGAGRQYVKACPVRGSTGMYCITENVKETVYKRNRDVR